ncbi:MAG: PQQ-dependent dehydrogenase, methanol/ethanol family [Acidocella sp.]|nr:PQQ-dependent dehydrogenase, methanol/ethanol family [Acidocella sp.]
MNHLNEPSAGRKPGLSARVSRIGRASLMASVATMLLCGAASAQTNASTGLSAKQIKAATDKVTGAAIIANAKTSDNWPTISGDYWENRFSHLTSINADNVKSLGLVWTYDMKSTRGVEATPVVVDGIMYVTAPWSIVHAIDVRTGNEIWSYDPKVPGKDGKKGCCDVVNRGVAVYKGKVYVASFDGRLIALDAATGHVDWQINTITDPKHDYTITDAPRVIDGNVLIGNGGSEYGTRGYVSAFNAETGALAWRFYVVPGNPAHPYKSKAMAAAAKTWDPASKYWLVGGGGSPWNGMAYDPKRNIVYFGTGNGTPWSASLRSPAGGSNLYLTSIVALNAGTGHLLWHYQETPHDNWDYDATQSMTLADMKIGGVETPVIMSASKNGFFFVLNRVTGKFISATPFVAENWAKGYTKDGVAMVNPEAIDTTKSFDAVPGPYGGHNWQPMSYNPMTGDAYIPAQNVPVTLMSDTAWRPNKDIPGVAMSANGWNLGEALDTTAPTSKPYGGLVAWNVAAGKPDWVHTYDSPWNGGTLTTAGNLVFQGTADGRFVAYNATTGAKLWQSPMGTGVMAGASTYMLNGVQYVSVAVGWGGVYGLAEHATDRDSPGTVYTFALGGTAPLPSFTKYQMDGLVQGVKYNPADVKPGTALYVSNCVFCHGVPGVNNGGAIPNLGYVNAAILTNLQNYVINGPYTAKGMPNYAGKLTPADVTQITAFIQGTADAIRPKS